MHGSIPPPAAPSADPQKQRLERAYAPLALTGQGTNRRRIYPEHLLPTSHAHMKRRRVDRLGPAAVAFFAGFVCGLGCICLGLFLSR